MQKMNRTEKFGAIPNGFSIPVFHATNDELEIGSLYSDERRLAFFADAEEAVIDYGRNVFKCYIQNNLKTAELTSFAKDKTSLNDLLQNFGKNKNLGPMLFSGKLWRNKPLERKVIDYLFGHGYELVKLLDERSEEDGEVFTTFIVSNPHSNVYVDNQR